MTTNEAPERIALRWEPGAAVTNGPLMTHPDYTRYVREDVAQSQKENAHEQGWDAGWQAAMASTAKPRVKPLVWRLDSGRNCSPCRYRADMPCGSGDYSVAGSESRNEWLWYRNGYHPPGQPKERPVMTFDDAKAAAQADYEARILAALVLP